MSHVFKIESEYTPAGDQPKAIESLVKGVRAGKNKQTLLGATGTGKTFTVANVIEHIQKPTLVIAHNKTLAAQLAQEYREFFPNNAVHYFVSYYDYYQPEAYLPVTDTYIEKEAQINAEIERLRHASTQALLTRQDTIIVASVSCIYGLGSPEEYEKVNLKVEVGSKLSRSVFVRQLVDIFYARTNGDLESGLFRAVGNTVEIMPVNELLAFRIIFSGTEIEKIEKFNPVSQEIVGTPTHFFLFPAKHFVSSEDQVERALITIHNELQDQLRVLRESGKNLEAERLKRRTEYDLAMIREIGYCNGIENYSRHFTGRKVGEAPDTLLSYFPHTADGKPDFLTIIDESHVTIPQIRGMYAGDQARKENLVEFGFRLPSAKDNRPLMFDEFDERVGQVLYTSATPGDYEREISEQIVEQIIRPTGLVDPVIDVKGVREDGTYPGQVKDFIKEAQEVVKKGDRVIATTLTKRMAEDMVDYLEEQGMKAEYLHSDIVTIERIEILSRFRKGEFDVLVGVNLLREGLDLPEVSLIGIFDADKEGFLRSQTSLLQIIGRAARNVNGRVILYADVMTGSIERAMDETERRREKQIAYNKKHGITPQTIKKRITSIADTIAREREQAVSTMMEVERDQFEKNPKQFIKEKEVQMQEAVKVLDFETAALLRDEIARLRKILEKKS